jgi:hypothetical protein
LSKEEAVLAARLLALFLSEERRQGGEPLLPAADQILGCEGVGQLLQGFRVAALQEGVGALLEANAPLPHPVRQPVMLVQADPRREGKVRADPHEEAPPPRIVHVEVVLLHPALFQFQMPTVGLLIPNRHQDARRLARFQDHHHGVGLRAPEVRFHEFIAPAFGRRQHRGAPLLGTILHPVMVLTGDLPQHIPANRVEVPVSPKETDRSLLLLKWLNQAIQQNPVEAPVVEPDVILMMLVKGVHGDLPGVRYLEDTT